MFSPIIYRKGRTIEITGRDLKDRKANLGFANDRLAPAVCAVACE